MSLLPTFVALLAPAEERARVTAAIGEGFTIMPFERDAGAVVLEYPWDVAIVSRQEAWQTSADLGERAVVLLSEPFDGGEVRALLHAAQRLVAARRTLALAHAHDAVRAALDPLTGLYNRTWFERELVERFAAASADGASLSLLVAGVDHFRSVNDLFGRRLADRVLLAISDILAAAVRTDDVAGRMDGEELALLTLRDRDEAVAAAEEIRAGVAGLTIRAGGARIRCTVSIGVASYPQLACSVADGLRFAAESALANAKERGRNQVCWI
jgi:diguanylate cyclase (GGDEF)-like protein